MAQKNRSPETGTEKAKGSPETVFQFLQDITDKLTLKKLAAVFVLGLLATFLTVVYENRTVLFDKIVTTIRGATTESGWELSDQTKSEMVGAVKGSKLMNLILVTEIDLQKNRRLPKYWFLESALEPQINNKAALLFPQPVFDLDAKNTQQMIGILNNEFVCTKFEDTIFYKLFPELTKEMPYICRLSIPPFYGRFVGILTVGLTRIPAKDEQEQLRIELARLSVEIYLRDVVKKNTPLIAPGH